ncbi:MAG TPA: YciI family protein [Candidatus Limnocylindria bacterium]|nr:YciI family protein [Candidatus Limnocylindria bacterium]
MTNYLLSVHTSEAPRPQMTDEDIQRSSAQIAALDAEMKAAGAWVVSGRLHAADNATVVKSHKGRIRTTDGPFVEAKEQIAGFYIIEAPDLDAAIGWASKASEAVGMPIEVRPFVDITIG